MSLPVERQKWPSSCHFSCEDLEWLALAGPTLAGLMKTSWTLVGLLGPHFPEALGTPPVTLGPAFEDLRAPSETTEDSETL